MAKASHNNTPSSSRREGHLQPPPYHRDEEGKGGVEDCLFFACEEVDERGEGDRVGQLALGGRLGEEHFSVHVLRGEHLLS